jgi:DNA-binding CsgD family transcriptional regulator
VFDHPYAEEAIGVSGRRVSASNGRREERRLALESAPPSSITTDRARRILMRITLRMTKPILLYGAAVAAGALLLRWLEYRTLVRMGSTPPYVAAVALIFVVLGIWIGNRTARPIALESFEPNERALEELGITPRELEVLELLARGQANREIARALYVSPNTVKTHLSSLYGKLDVSRRTQAVDRARSLRLIS